MRAEIIAIGTELLLGQLIDTNSAWIAQKLSDIGIDCHFQSTVGDNIDNISDALVRAQGRADIIICTGGLGPTQDDVTKEALAKTIGHPLIFDAALAKVIEAKFKHRSLPMSANNLRQAYYPEGVTILSAHPGTAPGICWQQREQLIFLTPGVPNEMKVMMEQSIVPQLKHCMPRSEKIVTKTLKLWGIPESNIAEQLDAINSVLEVKGNPKLSFLASGINGISVRFSAKACDEQSALTLIAPYYVEAKRLFGPYVFGEDEDSMESAVTKLLIEKKQSLALLESFSGGMIASRLHAYTEIGSYFKGAVVNMAEVTLETLQAQQQASGASIVLSISREGQQAEETMVALTMHVLMGADYHTKSLRVPHYNHGYAMEFSVVNGLNFLRRLLMN